MNKIICMIPAREGSQRIKNKALRKIGRLSLIEQAIELSLTYFKPEDVFLNTNWLRLEEISKKYKINFYKREEKFASSNATNDQFMNDFLKKNLCHRVVQLLPTSPFLTKNEFLRFNKVAKESTDKAVISVASHRIAAVKENGLPINFDRSRQNPPSQTMQAIYTYVGVLMSWDREIFLKQYNLNGCAYHGSDENVYFPLDFLSQLDIDTEKDLNQAQSLESFLPNHKKNKNFNN